MEYIKPQRITNFFDYFPLAKKRKLSEQVPAQIQPTIIRTCLEDFSNEIFYEIFQYLDMYDVYKGFYSLNGRLQKLCNSTCPLKISLSFISKSNFEQYNRQFLIPNRYRIQSLHISNPFLVDLFFSPVKTVTYLHRLETLILNEVKLKYFSNIFRYLASLQNLSTLIILSNEKLNKIFESIFRLPKLKYCKLKYPLHFGDVTILPNNNNLTSSIEHFIIETNVDFSTLVRLLPFLPHLQTLSIRSLEKTYGTFSDNVLKLNHLKKVQFDKTTISFDEFEWISKQLFDQLEVLRLSINCDDGGYLNAHRWEQLISDSMPKLRIFDFRYDVRLNTANDEDAHQIYRKIQNDFASSFWFQRKWFFYYQFYELYEKRVMFSSIDTNRKEYVFCKKLDDDVPRRNRAECIKIFNEDAMLSTSQYFPRAIQLILSDQLKITGEYISDSLNLLIPLKQLTNLTIDSYSFSTKQVIQLLYAMPNVVTLSLQANSTHDDNYMELKQSEIFQKVAKTNKISQLNVNAKYQTDYFEWLIFLFPQTEYLIVNVTRQKAERVVRFIGLNRQTNFPKLGLLCLQCSFRQNLYFLNNLIKTEELFDNCYYKTIEDKFYVCF